MLGTRAHCRADGARQALPPVSPYLHCPKRVPSRSLPFLAMPPAKVGLADEFRPARSSRVMGEGFPRCTCHPDRAWPEMQRCETVCMGQPAIARRIMRNFNIVVQPGKIQCINHAARHELAGQPEHPLFDLRLKQSGAMRQLRNAEPAARTGKCLKYLVSDRFNNSFHANLTHSSHRCCMIGKH